MIEIFKKERSEKYLRSPNRNLPDIEIDENRWVKDLYKDLKKDV
jgi:hypothetical protein